MLNRHDRQRCDIHVCMLNHVRKSCSMKVKVHLSERISIQVELLLLLLLLMLGLLRIVHCNIFSIYSAVANTAMIPGASPSKQTFF